MLLLRDCTFHLVGNDEKISRRSLDDYQSDAKIKTYLLGRTKQNNLLILNEILII